MKGTTAVADGDFGATLDTGGAAGACGEMEPGHVRGVFNGELSADARADICALRTVPGIAQARHQLRPNGHDALGPVAALAGFA